MALRDFAWRGQGGSRGWTMTDSSPLLDGLPGEQRLALAYARGAARPLFLGLFALDARLAQVVRSAREPMLAQLRLAWWRERLAESAPRGGEPVLALLAPLLAAGPGLSALADGWEALLGDGTIEPSAIEQFAEGRAAAYRLLARHLGGDPAEAERAARNWAMADLAGHLSAPDERMAALAIAAAQDWRRPALPRALRPLAVLHGLARRHRGAQPLIAGPAGLGAAIRLGLLGR